MEEISTIGILQKIILGYMTLVSFILGMGLPLFENHKKFIQRPELLVLGAVLLLHDALGSYRLAFSVIFIFYVSSLMISNVRETYDNLFGVLSPLVIKISGYFGFLDDSIFDDTVIEDDLEEDDFSEDDFSEDN